MRRWKRDDIDPSTVQEFARRVTDRLGIRADEETLRLLLAERVAATAAQTPAIYVEALDSAQRTREWTLLARRLTVPETYFFRNEAHWKAFTKHVIPMLTERHHADGVPLRIWSAGCSTGEEPYTIAIALKEAGLSRLLAKGGIKATDLVEESLATARQGTYGRNSFRGVGKERKDRFFQRKGNSLAVDGEIRKFVSFAKLNLADPTAVSAFIAQHGPFHIIFCRNVLIYFQPDHCRRLLGRLSAALTDNGTMFVGHAEFPNMWTDALEPVGVCNTFVWRRRTASGDAAVRRQALDTTCYATSSTFHAEADAYSTATTTVPGTEAKLSVVSTTSVAMRPSTNLPTTPKEESPNFWGTAFEVIENVRRGQTDAALAAAQRFVEQDDLIPEAYYALGTALETAGQAEQAKTAYQKAVFLDAHFAHAHWRLALLWAAGGKGERAVSEARWALQSIAGESDLRIRHLSDVDRRELTTMMEHTLEWLQPQRE